jgi:hypothetical protein
MMRQTLSFKVKVTLPPIQCCTFWTRSGTDFEVTPNRQAIVVEDHLSESRLRPMRPTRADPPSTDTPLLESWQKDRLFYR